MFQNSVTLELSLNQKDYFRVVYGGLDFVADLGGLFSAVAGVCSIILSLFNFHAVY